MPDLMNGGCRTHLLDPVETGLEGDLHGRLVVHGDDLGLGQAHVLEGTRGVVDDGHVGVCVAVVRDATRIRGEKYLSKI